MFVFNANPKSLKILALLFIFVPQINSKCSTTFITTCEKISDLQRYGQNTWKNLIVDRDRSNTGVSDAPSEVLKAQDFSNTPNIEELYIIEKLTDIEFGAFKDLNQLTYLKLYKNFIKVLHRGALSNIPQLFKLDLTHNSIENIQHELFVNSYITNIDLSNNKLSNIQVNMVALPSLRKLILRDNLISFLAPKCFHENLRHLDLSNNLLSDINSEVLQYLSNLKELSLSGNKFNGIAVEYSLPSLEKLDLSHNQIQSIKEGSFKKFYELKHLYLDNNLLSVLNPDIFPTPNDIEVVHLHLNALMSLNLRIGATLPALREMSLGANPWSCSCLPVIFHYFAEKRIVQPVADSRFFSNGVSAICVVAEDTCTGNEVTTREIFDEYRSAVKGYDS